ncbi:MAG: type II toxin-antitoxin system RelE/ParE family toxin [Candidatus Omnitrophica bacterium]|nr:type II toxin-antitoxin system RelE/ParE family toxin [Candidatus Omnitrophota bacterium]MBU4141200.1 type II toxin-antitoxin system RelE/ParE family toxin [Candidatus Omnitrophota bacterium]
MAEFKAIFTKVAEKDLDALDPKTRLRILQATKALEASPFPRADTVKKLKGAKIALYRLRVGDFRVVYHIDGRKIAVLFVVDRKDLEKRLKAFL